MEKSLFTCPICAAPWSGGSGPMPAPTATPTTRPERGYVHLLPANKKALQGPRRRQGHGGRPAAGFSPGDTTATCWPPCAPWGRSTPRQGRRCWTRAAARGTTPPDCGRPWAARPWRESTCPSRRCAWPPGGCRRGSSPWPPPTICLWRMPRWGWCSTASPPWPWTSSGGCSAPAGPSSMWCPPPTTCGSSSRCSTTSPTATGRRTSPYEGFSYERVEPVEAVVDVAGEALRDLFQMTPYYWKTPREGAERLAALDGLRVRASFRVHVFRRR